MYGKALLFVVLVVVGAVLPYLLADQKFIGKVGALLPSQSSTANEPDAVAEKPTTAGKPITIASHKLAQPGIQPPVGNTQAFGDLSQSPLLQSPNEQSPYAGGLAQGHPAATQPIGLATGGLATVRPNGEPYPTARPRTASPVEVSGLVGPRGIPIQHVLSFEVTPEWLTDNWTRVTTGLPELDLTGWRVPVAFASPYDFAGSATYYFDRQKRVQRILLHGFSSNPAELAQLATTRYQMQRIPNYLTEMYLHLDRGHPLGGLRIANSALRKTKSRSEILLELNRQGSTYGMSEEFAKLLERLHERDQQLDRMPELDLESSAAYRNKTRQQSLEEAQRILDGKLGQETSGGRTPSSPKGVGQLNPTSPTVSQIPQGSLLRTTPIRPPFRRLPK